ncbi:MAG: molybdopterin converting factor subunit 1 [Planctomycetota bacterium]|nr:MAG: molybdopterin converting factor subunit 1 [Planctomycetota bacterium]
MNVTLHLFAVARELAQSDTLELELPEGATVGQLREHLAAEHPALAEILPHVLFAVDSEYVDNERTLSPECQIACIPPVSGG